MPNADKIIFVNYFYNIESEKNMLSLNGNLIIDYSKIKVDSYWNEEDISELKMHTIHSYPAKFPAFIASKAFDFAKNEGVDIKNVADIFCGCGTVALEAKNHNYNFWGSDLNPVAVLIAKTKSRNYDVNKLTEYYEKILEFHNKNIFLNDYINANERLKYWFTEDNYFSLLKIYQSIETIVSEKIYKEAFQCIFSSILKSSSKWLMKSIKPQVDPKKKYSDIFTKFNKNYNKFLIAVKELPRTNNFNEIVQGNFLEIKEIPKVDLIITSPPYVTSYEYADLHQLSSLWLKYTDDYRELRKGSIGSIYNNKEIIFYYEYLNESGKFIIDELRRKKISDNKIKSIAKYFYDMQKVIKKSKNMLNSNGMIFFVIGDTEYKGTKILNSKHLIETLNENGFSDIKINKRNISKKICIPYRDENGKFSRDKSQKKIYHEEFIISGRIKNEY